MAIHTFNNLDLEKIKADYDCEVYRRLEIAIPVFEESRTETNMWASKKKRTRPTYKTRMDRRLSGAR